MTKSRPILFSAPMVRALLDGSKTQTRRVVKESSGLLVYLQQGYGEATLSVIEPGKAPAHTRTPGRPHTELVVPRCPHGQPGDQLWVREAWRTTGDGGRCNFMPPRDLQPHEVWYEAAGVPPIDECAGKLRPSMFMPRWASRITLEITSVRVERLQDISEADALAEGVYDGKACQCEQPLDFVRSCGNCGGRLIDAVDLYRSLWESINGVGSWELNPWVWCVSFKQQNS